MVRALDEVIMRGQVSITRSTSIHEKISLGDIDGYVIPMKTLLLQSKNHNSSEYILLTIPYTMKYDSKLLSSIFGISRSKAKKYRLAKDIPRELGMSNGYFHPFYPEELEIVAGIILPRDYLEFQVSPELSVVLDSETTREIIKKPYDKYKIIRDEILYL